MTTPSLISCRACGHKISPNAASCPSCGEPNGDRIAETGDPKGKQTATGFLAALLIGLIIGGALYIVLVYS